MSNDPRLDGQNTNPPQTLDYERIAEATDMTVAWDTQGGGRATPTEIGERVDLDAVYKMAMQRAEETKGLWGNTRPGATQIHRQFIHVWMEGFMYALVYTEQAKLTSLFGKLPDHNLLGATNSIIGGHWGEDREEQWKKRIDGATLVHVASVRSIQAIQIRQLDKPPLDELVTTQAAHWADGFSMGLLFAELGGHRED
ncbi:hypothetical protein [Streptomyces sp. H27-C3]|uniref:hypothetical protein n=1 Tax=Streptomyces sp. H27-C3 TaxID=3046305 RepID=UPI0024B8D99A|nr:hypothetical protein [Streptomyces sp. H27-C3]MDJ0463064.1 hypothetical protein [Streptomyces sp. H27-C3]